MERVGTLINKLKEQFEQQASPNSLFHTAQMLLAELQPQVTAHVSGKVAVTMPPLHRTQVTIQETSPQKVEASVIDPEPAKEKINPVQEELAYSTKEYVAQVETVQETAHSSWLFDPVVATIPTLAHQEVKEVFELHETIVVDTEVESHNDKLKEERVEVAAVLQGTPIKDLKRAIGINDRYLFINELFRGDENMYERSIKTINAFSIYPEAEYWIQREMKTKLGWLEDTEAVRLFDQLVKRRFS